MTKAEFAATPRPGVLSIAPYQAGGSHVEGAARIIKLSSNENSWGPSPKAVAAYEKAAANLALYPDPDCRSLRQAIGEVQGLNPDQIICGNGSDELLQLIGYGWLRDGDELVHSRHGFLLYPSYALMNGARPVAAAETNLTSDVDALLAACSERTRLVYIANPNNPTGTRLNAQEVERLAAGIPKQALLVLDGAYAEYVDADDYDGGASLVARYPNVVMSRTFSKIYGLAALRIGWIFASPEVVDVINRIRGPFNLNAGAQAAAEAAMRDVDYTAKVKADTLRLRGELIATLNGLGVSTTPTETNFILAHFGNDPETGAVAADAFLKSRGIIVRRMESYGLTGNLRISVGNEEGCAALTAALKEFRGRV